MAPFPTAKRRWIEFRGVLSNTDLTILACFQIGIKLNSSLYQHPFNQCSKTAKNDKYPYQIRYYANNHEITYLKLSNNQHNHLFVDFHQRHHARVNVKQAHHALDLRSIEYWQNLNVKWVLSDGDINIINIFFVTEWKCKLKHLQILLHIFILSSETACFKSVPKKVTVTLKGGRGSVVFRKFWSRFRLKTPKMVLSDEREGRGVSQNSQNSVTLTFGTL